MRNIHNKRTQLKAIFVDLLRKAVIADRPIKFAGYVCLGDVCGRRECADPLRRKGTNRT